MNSLFLIIQREYLSRVRTKSFLLATLLTPIAFLFIIGLPGYLMSKNDTEIKVVYVIDRTDKYYHLLESNDNYTFIHIKDNSSQEKMDALLQIDRNLNTNPLAATFFSEQQQPPRDLIKYINKVLSDAVKTEQMDNIITTGNIDPQLAVDMQHVLKSKDPINVNTMRWMEDGNTSDTLGDATTAIGMGLTFVMMMFIMMYGSWVVQSVVEEKSNRIIEVIISSVKPFDLMMGKIIGIAFAGITQLFFWIVLALITGLGIILFMGNEIATNVVDIQESLSANGNMPNILESLSQLESINWLQIIICFVLYFTGGYLLFAAMFAMFASAANDAQEAQQLTTPLIILLLVAFYTGYAAVHNPEGSIALWCSFIPFTSPIVMMVRTPFDIPIWQLFISLTILYSTVILMVKMAAKIYRTGILMHGKKASIKEIVKWFSYK